MLSSSMIKLKLRLDDGRGTTTITLPEEFKLTLDARRTRSLDALLPILYLRGISTGDARRLSRLSSARTLPTSRRR